MTYREYFEEAQRLRDIDAGARMMDAEIISRDAVSGYVLMALDSLGILGEEEVQEVVETVKKMGVVSPGDAERYLEER